MEFTFTALSYISVDTSLNACGREPFPGTGYKQSKHKSFREVYCGYLSYLICLLVLNDIYCASVVGLWMLWYSRIHQHGKRTHWWNARLQCPNTHSLKVNVSLAITSQFNNVRDWYFTNILVWVCFKHSTLSIQFLHTI